MRLASEQAASYVRFAGDFQGGSINVDGTLDVGGFATTLNQLTGSGTITNTGAAVTITTRNLLADTTFAGSIRNGTGVVSLTHDGGTLTLTGNNTYSGGTTISAGTVQIGNGSALGTGEVRFNGGALRAGNTLTLDNNIRISGSQNATISAATGTTLTLRGDYVDEGGGITRFGSATDTGTIVAALGTFSAFGLVSAVSPHAISIDGGTLRLASEQAASYVRFAGDFQGGSINVDGTLDVGGFATRLNQLTGSGTITNTGAAVTITTRNLLADTTFAGSIRNGTGVVSLTHDGGTLTLTGSNSYSGTTRINSGTLQVGNGGTTGTLGSGDVTNNGLLVFNRSDNVSFDDDISGTGGLTHAGTGILTLLGANSYSGTTTISGGELRIGSGMFGTGVGTGDFVNNGVLTFVSADNRNLANNISGTGRVVFSGNSAWTLTGTNAHQGGTTAANGASVTFGGTGALGAGNLVLESGSKFVLDFDGTFSNAVFTQAASNTTLGVAAGRIVTYNGTLFLGSDSLLRLGSATETGTLIVNSPAALPLTTVSLSVDGGTVRIGANGNTPIFSTIGLTGTGGITLASAATLDINGVNVTLRRLNGTGTLANTGGAATISLLNTTSFTGTIDTGSGGITLTGSLAGTSAITKTGAGTLTFAAGLNTAGHTGGLNLTRGTLSLRSNLAGTFGTITTTGSVIDYADGITNAAAIAINSNTTQLQVLTGSATQSGVISQIGGSRGFEKIGAGTLTLTGANTFTGTATISQGTLALGANNVLADGTFVRIAGGTLALGSFTDTVLGVEMASGSITGGTGSLLTITGNYIQTGGTLAAGARVDVGVAGIIDLSGGTMAGTLNGLRTGTRSGIVDGGTARVTGRLTMAGDLNVSEFGTGRLNIDSGGLVQSRDGVIGVNALSVGSVTVSGQGSRLDNAGELQIGRSGAGTLTIAEGGAVTAGSVVIARDATTTGTLIFGAAEGNPAVAAGTLTTPTIAMGAGTASIIFNHTSADLALAAAISGNGTLRHLAGTTTLSGASTFLGLANVLGGTLRVTGSLASNVLVGAGTLGNSGTISGLVTNNGTLTSTGTLGGGLVNAAGASATISGVLNGAVSNSGSLTLSGTTTANGAFSQTVGGVFDLAGNNAAIGSLAGAGMVSLGAGGLTVGSNGTDTRFDGVIDGSGTLTKVGTGTLVLGGANTYNGGTTINGGTLQIGAGGTTGAISGPVVNNGALVISRSDAVTFANRVSGTGMFVQDGTGTTTLTAANTYGGGTLVNRGRLAGTTASLQGLIQINAGAALEFAQVSAGTFAGSLRGAGLFEKTGAGLLTLTGNSNAFTGATTVRAGELRVNGGLAGSVVTVGTGATLSGTGTIGGLIAQSGSTIAPGTSPGVLGVAGNVTLQAGSTTVFEVSATGPSDLILATGTAALGGTAALINLGGNYRFGSEITLIQADGGTSGTFAAVTGLESFGIRYRPELIYVAGQARLRMAPNLLANIVGTTPLTANQRSVVNRIDGAVTAAGYNPDPLFAIYSLPTAQLPGAFDQLSGEAYATAAGVGIEQERFMREAVLGRLASVRQVARSAPEQGKGVQAWGQIYGGWGDGESDGNAAAFDTDRMGFVTGLDVGSASENGSWRAGAFGMRVQSDVTIDARGSASEVRQAGGGVYAALTAGGFGVALGGYLSSVDLRTFRDIALPGFADTLVGTTEGKARQAFAEVSYTIEAGNAQVRPFVAGSVGRLTLDALTERGGAAALTMREQRYDTGTVTGGVDAGVAVGKALRLGGTLAARRHLGDRDPQAQLALAAAPQQAFAVQGAQLDRTALAARLDAMFTFEENLSITLGYSGLIGNTQTDHAARATIEVRF